MHTRCQLQKRSSQKIDKASKFAKIDLKSAYWQVELDDAAKELSIINTHKGLYCLNRLLMGMKNSSSIFQRAIEHILKGIPGVVVYQDDVMIVAESTPQLQKRLSAVHKRLKDHNVTINLDKCADCTDELRFLGFVFSGTGIRPDDSLLTKIRDMPRPETQKQLVSFLGLVNYYARFVQDFAETCVPLNEVRNAKTQELSWNEDCERSFIALKEKLTSKPVLHPFSLSKRSTLTVDASCKSIGAVLSQENHPCIFISRKLTPAETNYSNIEREALAAVWACKRLKHFLVGKQFTLRSDHRPLIHIYGPNTSLRSEISPRLLKFSLKMMQFDFQIEHIPGKQNTIADSLSRMADSDPEVTVPQIHFSETCVGIDQLRQETCADKFLCDLKRRIINGDWTKVTKRELPFKKKAMQLTVDENDCVRLGSKVVPPQNLFRRVFEIAHQSHNGMQATLTLIQQEFFWPGMRQHVEAWVSNCDICRRSRFKGADTTHKWPSDSNPWTRIHIDWAQHPRAGNILVIADSTTGWLEAAICSNRSTGLVIEHLRALFARFGVPHLLVSDNAPEFVCREFREWLGNIGCRLMHSPEYRPQANGLAERMVRVVKSSLRCYNPSKSSITAFLHRVLFVHRNTAMRNGSTPAQQMLGRTARCPILSHFKPLEEVLYKPNAKAPARAVTFLFRQGQNTSLVSHSDGRTVLAHDAQLSRAGEENPDNSLNERPVRNRALPNFYGDMLIY